MAPCPPPCWQPWPFAVRKPSVVVKWPGVASGDMRGTATSAAPRGKRHAWWQTSCVHGGGKPAEQKGHVQCMHVEVKFRQGNRSPWHWLGTVPPWMDDVVRHFRKGHGPSARQHPPPRQTEDTTTSHMTKYTYYGYYVLCTYVCTWLHILLYSRTWAPVSCFYLRPRLNSQPPNSPLHVLFFLGHPTCR